MSQIFRIYASVVDFRGTWNVDAERRTQNAECGMRILTLRPVYTNAESILKLQAIGAVNCIYVTVVHIQSGGSNSKSLPLFRRHT
ncbi:hypothetical protein [Leptospira sanjuanensis]|uniref:hypothetical protein n=1 Tax=Leptospira sanjuanensis TaxID=2879643 RepID=UPI001EE7FE6C|nr:hypothetical protein [Leptospira sanjuanensis]MCG6167367.1 hypothetical protein [Leptospira sanjuanensis]